MSSYLTPEQYRVLLRPINPRRVSQRQNMSHLEAYDVRAHLNRCFGFARWDADLLNLDLLFETVVDDKRVSVGYRATFRLVIKAPDGTVLASYTEAATGDASNFPMTKRADAHDFAIKTAESQALKRCATNLGSQFGLSLYAKGSLDEIVGRSLVSPEDEVANATTAGVDEHITEQLPAEDERPEPAPTVTAEQKATVDRLRAATADLQKRGKAS